MTWSFSSRRKKGLGIALGLQTTLVAMAWVPQGAQTPAQISKITYDELGKLDEETQEEEEQLPEELKAVSNPNKPVKECLEEAQNAIEQFKKGQWQYKGKDGKVYVFADTVSRVADRINQYKGVIEPLTQFSPFCPSLVWGMFSTVLKIATDDAEMRYNLIDFIDKYMDVSDILATYWKLYRHSSGQSSLKVQQQIERLEEQIRKFVNAAEKYVNKSPARRLLGSPFSVEFQPICDTIQDLIKTFTLSVDAAKDEDRRRTEILDWISKSRYKDTQANQTTKRGANTCEWIYRKKNFLDWMEPPSSCVLWVHGNAGFGKSILMSSMVDYFQRTLPSGDLSHKHVAYFYCLHYDKETLDTVVILSSILKQLAASFPDFPDMITGRFQNDKRSGGLGGLSLTTIKEFLTAIIRQACLPLFILIDGIDECNEETRVNLLGFLMPLTLESDSGPSNIVKICLFSRPYHDIREHLASKLDLDPDSDSDSNLKKLLEIPIQKEDTVDDMRTFLKGKITLNTSLDKFLKKNEDLRDQVIRDLVTKADGMFLWVSLQQTGLYHQRRTVNSIKDYLQELPHPKNMEESYIRILTHIQGGSTKDCKLAGTVLCWLLCADRPLLVTELMDALLFLKLVEEESPQEILEVCYGLVIIEIHNDAKRFRFLHFSVHQFLCEYFEEQLTSTTRIATGLRRLIPGMDGDEQRLDFRKSIHHEMAQTCVEYILQSGETELLARDAVYRCRQEFDLLATKNPFFVYASLAWVEHFRSAGDSTDLSNICLTLFRNTQKVQLSFQIFWFQKQVDNFPRGSTPLHIASYLKLPRIILPLLAGIDGPLPTDNHGRSPIYWAAYQDDSASLEALGVRSRDCEKQLLGEALFAAVEGEKRKLIAQLINWGADPNAYIQSKKNALSYAILKGDSNLPVVQQLIKAREKLAPGAPLTSPPITSPLQVAATAGALKITQYLLSLQNVDVNDKAYDPPGLPLEMAVLAGQHAIAKLLLDSGADIVLAGERLISMASFVGDSKMIDILLQHTSSSKCTKGEDKSPVNIGLKTPGPDISDQPAETSASHLNTLQSIFKRVLPFLDKTKLSQFAVTMGLNIVRKMVESNFEALDHSFLEAFERATQEWVKELTGYNGPAVSWEIFANTLCPMMVNMAQEVQTTEQVEYYEYLLKIMAKVVIAVTDGGSGATICEAVMNREKNLLEAIEKKQTETVDKGFAEAEVVSLAFVDMERFPHMLRLNIRSVLRSVLAITPPEEGEARFAKTLDGVTVEPMIRPGNWHRIIIFIEMANCAYAYGYKRLYPQINVKAVKLRREMKDHPNLTLDETVMNQLDTVVVGGKENWQWDADEAPWWFHSE